MADEQHRQDGAGVGDHLHQSLEAGQRLVMEVVCLVDDEHHRALALAHQVTQVAFPALRLSEDARGWSS